MAKTRKHKKQKKQRGGAASIGILLGRFQPFHIGHLSVVLKGLEDEDKFLIFIGQDGLNDANPYTFEERRNFIVGSVLETRPDLVDKLNFQASPEAPKNNDWDVWHSEFYALLKEKISSFGGTAATARLYCFNKDLKTTAYLKKITEEASHIMGIRELDIGTGTILNATELRLILKKAIETKVDYGKLIIDLNGSVPRYVLYSLLSKIFSQVNT